MGASGAVEILYRKELSQAEDRTSRAAELSDAYNQSFATPKIASDRGFLDAVFERQATRESLCRALKAVIGKREDMPSKRNGNVPL